MAETETAAESEAITTLEDALTEIEVAPMPLDEGASQNQIVAIEEPKTPDPIHPKTIVGKSIDGLGASLGFGPDFFRSTRKTRAETHRRSHEINFVRITTWFRQRGELKFYLT